MIEYLIGLYFIFCITWSYFLLFSARKQLKNPFSYPTPTLWPSVTVLVPAYNEAKCIVESIQSTLAIDYHRPIDVVVCDDGSTDNTLSLLREHFGDNPRVTIVSKPNGGRASALNAALEKATGDLVVATDADTLIDRRGLDTIVSAMVADPTLEAVGGTILLANDVTVQHGEVVGQVPRKWVAGIQAVEYLRAFIYGRLGLNTLGGNVIVSGAFGVFRRSTVQRLGGWDENTVAEDFDITVKIRDEGGKVLFIPEPTAWTEAPEDYATLGSQRDRWHRGLSQILWRWGKHTMFRPSKGLLGMFVLPMFLFIEWLAPFVEATGYVLLLSHIAFGTIHASQAALLFLLAYVLGVGLSFMAIHMEQRTYARYQGKRDTLRLYGYALIEPFWYRPLTVYWRIKGWIRSVFGNNSWGNMTRKGLAAVCLFAMIGFLSQDVKAQQVTVGTTIESGQVTTRTDTWLSAGNKHLTMEARQVTRVGFTDARLALSGRKSVGALLLGIEGSVSPEAVLIPFQTYGGTVGVRLPHGFVVEGRAVRQQFTTGMDISLRMVNVDYYRGDYRLGVAGGNTTVSETGFGRVSAQVIKSGWNATLFVSEGNEILDAPRVVGRVREGGLTGRAHLGRFHALGGLSVGQRQGLDYTTKTIGFGFNF